MAIGTGTTLELETSLFTGRKEDSDLLDVT